MPRQPKTTTALRRLRVAQKLTQAQFARRIGVGFDSLQSYEIGRTRIPDALAVRIGAEFGVLPASLYDPAGPYAWPGEETSSPDVDAIRRLARARGWPEPKVISAEDHARGLTESMAGWIGLLFGAASETGQLAAVNAAVAKSLSEVRERFGLERKTDRVLAERPIEHRLAMPYGDLRRMHPDQRRRFKCKLPPNVKDEDLIEALIAESVRWEPGLRPVPPLPSKG